MGGRLTLRARLFGIAAAGLVLTGVVGAVGLSGYAGLAAANRAEVRLGTIQSLALQTQSIQHKVRAQAWFAVAQSGGGTGRSATEVRTEFTAARAEMLATTANLGDLVAGTAYQQRIENLVEAQDLMIAQAGEVIGRGVTERPAALAGIGTLEDEADTLDVEVSDLVAALSADRARQLAAGERVGRADSWRLLGAMLVAALLGVLLSVFTARSILRRLGAVADAAQRVGAGDLDARAEVPGRDEIGALARSFNDTADALSETMRQLTAEARREKLSSQLAEALDMAETEPDVYAAVGKALTVIDPHRPAALLLADNSQAHLHVRTVSGPPAAACCPVTSPFDCVAVRRGHAMSFADSDALDACPKLAGRPEGRLSAICVPLTFMGRSLGVVHTSGPPDRPAEPETLAGLTALAAQAGNRIGTLRSFALAKLQASTDALTGLPNRRAFESAARDRLAAGGELVVVMADLDRFKVLNDTFGHEAGDRALRLFGRVARAALRPEDLICRWGGEEFCLILPGVSAEQGVKLLDQFRADLRDALDSGTPPFTASFGACWTGGGTPLDELLRAADQALYLAKSEGRDRVVTAGQHDRRARSGV